MPSKPKKSKGKKKQHGNKKKDVGAKEASGTNSSQAQSTKENLDYAVLEDHEVNLVNDVKNNNETKTSESPFDTFVSKFEIGDTPKVADKLSEGNLGGSKVKFERVFPDVSNNNSNGVKNMNKNTKTLDEKEDQIVPGGDLKTIEDFIKLGVPRNIVLMKHPLEHPWSFWYFKNDKSLSWERNQQNVATVDTIEDFWQVYNYIEPASKLGTGCDYSVFKKGIMPDWEDFQNMSGGRWIINSERAARSELLDNYWLETLFILIGEHASEYANMVNGAVCNIRNKGDKVAVWIRDANNTPGVMKIGKLVKTRLGLSNRINFSVHREDSGRTRFGSQNSPSKIFV